MSKNSKDKRRTWVEVRRDAKAQRGRHAADDSVTPIVPDTSIETDYAGRHRAPENPCAPTTSESYSPPDTGSSVDSGGSCD